jgi:hypothetical protein
MTEVFHRNDAGIWSGKLNLSIFPRRSKIIIRIRTRNNKKVKILAETAVWRIQNFDYIE